MSNPDPKSAPVVFLKGKRIYMRPIALSDTSILHRYINDPFVREFVSAQFPQSELAEEEFIRENGKHKSNPSHVQLGIVLVDTDELIGVMSLGDINWKDRRATTGAFIGPVEHRGKGYGTEAKMILLDYAFNQINLRKICSRALAHNGASLGFNAKCGYKEEARFKQHVFVNGEYIDLVCTAVFRDDFMPLWEVYKKEYLS